MISTSVVMPVRNAERFIEEALSSTTSQTFSDFEVLVVLDSSTDGSEQLARVCARRDPRIRILVNTGLGLVDALNTGCHSARGGLIARLDADDRMHAARLQRQSEFMQRHPDVVAVGSSAIVIDAASQVVGRISVPTSDASLRLRLVRGNPFVHSSMLMRKSALVAAGGYRNDFPLVEDLDLWLRLARLGKLANLSEPLVDYRRHQAGLSAPNEEEQRLAQHLCLLEWKRSEGLVSETTVHSVRRDLVGLFGHMPDLAMRPATFQEADLLLFRRLLPHLGSREARRLRRVVADAYKVGRIGRAAAIRFGLEATVSRMTFDLRSRAAARRLTYSSAPAAEQAGVDPR